MTCRRLFRGHLKRLPMTFAAAACISILVIGAFHGRALATQAAPQSAPRHYVFYGRDRDALRRDSLFFRSNAFEGAQLAYPWRQLERGKEASLFVLEANDGYCCERQQLDGEKPAGYP